ncbi:MAG: aromatic-L-amino-acid/L-tryptophan decarboxylase [Acidobacteriota bacterium]|nr:aromatic-L-amino-acid/L-tryptophan decarboxylase [Acidobacteriota bacterium]
MAHRALDEALDSLEGIREQPAWRSFSEVLQRRLAQPIPRGPQPLEEVYRELLEVVLPYSLGNRHPRFWGWVNGTGTPLAVIAELLAAALNANVGGRDHAAGFVEERVVEWWRELMGFPLGTGGLLVSGASMANLVGLAAARNAQAGWDVRRLGLRGGSFRMIFYASAEAHASVRRALELLGIGHGCLRLIRTGEDFRIDLAALESAIRQDHVRGDRPACVVGTAGTTNTGAVDDLAGLAAICRAERLWLHVDGAFGALAVLSPSLRPLLAGLEAADSLAFDLHKWMYLPYGVGCVLARREGDLRSAFSLVPEYLEKMPRGVATGANHFSDLGPELSRGFRALKVWMALKVHGVEKHARLIEQNVAQAQYLAQRVESSPDLELLAPVSLNVVCFRFAADLPEEELSALNREILMRLQESGVAVPSGTVIRGRYALRAAVTNHRSRREDFDVLVEEVVRIGRELVG